MTLISPPIISFTSTSNSTRPYELDQCQIDTPDNVVREFWKIVQKHRKDLGDVIDLGAGDGRFALEAKYKLYHGYEIDRQRLTRAGLPATAEIIYNCAFEAPRSDYDVCVGNPPYVNHHDIEAAWREQLVERIHKELGINSNRLCNLFVYFICLGLIKTKDTGLVALLIPYEWVSRPSAKPLRAFIQKKRWDVHVYRFRSAVFKGVLTTAAISVIDKAGTSGRWRYYDITSDFEVLPKKQISGSKHAVLRYEARENIWSLRGLSPGSQKIFTLTEGQRAKAGLWKSDVTPCVTSLRNFPEKIGTLTKSGFIRYFVNADRKCWLIRSDGELNGRLRRYLNSIPKESRDNFTCNERKPWHRFRPHPVPKILFGSGFTSHGPKFIVNKLGAIAIGSVCGIHSKWRFDAARLSRQLRSVNFERRIVAHAKSLKKVEIGQMNAVLNSLSGSRAESAGRAR